MITTVLAFVLTLGVLIVIHEYGHYRVARACGVKVLRFSVGFGRVLWRRQATPDSTEFVVCALPLGGYVKMLDEREGPVAPADVERAFNRKPLGQRAAIVAAGPAANLLLAVLLYAAAHWIGVEEPKAVLGPPVASSLADRAGLHAGDWVRAYSSDGNEWQDLRSLTELRWEVTQAVLRGEKLQLAVTNRDGRQRHVAVLDLDTLDTSDVDAALMQRIGIGSAYSEPVLGEVRPNGPADRAGLRAGDRVLSIDAEPIEDASRIRSLIRESVDGGAARPLTWRVQRGGRLLDLTVTPAVVVENGARIGRVEVYPGQPPQMVTVRYGPIEGLSKAVVQTWDMSALTLKMLGRMVIGQASLKNLSGPLTIADYAGQSVRLGLAYYLGFLAIVSGPLRFFSEACPITMRPSILSVSADMSHVCSTALLRPSIGP